MVLGDFAVSKRKDPYEIHAEHILKKINQKSFLDVDLYEMCELFGIDVNLNLVDETNCAIYHPKGRRGIINLAISSCERKEREALAHEFAHLYMHYSNQITQFQKVVEKEELQAFKLASNILIPSKELLKIEVNPDLNVTYIMAEEVADLFDVTVEFAFKRLKYFNQYYRFSKEDNRNYSMSKSTPNMFNLQYGYVFDPNPRKIVITINNKKELILL